MSVAVTCYIGETDLVVNSVRALVRSVFPTGGRSSPIVLLRSERFLPEGSWTNVRS